MRYLFFANTEWYLYNFRLPLIRAVCAQGHEAALVSPPGPYARYFEEVGLRWMPFPLRRSGTNPLSEAVMLLRPISLYRRESPDVVHHFTFKCVLLGSLAARFLGIKCVVNSITGAGYMFADRGFWTRMLRPFVKAISKVTLPDTQVIFQNPPRSAEALAHAINLLINDPALRAQMGVRGRETAIEQFSEEKVIAATLSVYRTVVSCCDPGSQIP